MDPFSAWVEGTWLSTTMRDTTWLWPLCESIHFIGLALLIGGAGYFDLRLIGFMRRIPVAAAKAFMPWAIAGFAMNLVTGTAFFIMAPHMYVLSPPWWAKVFFIVLAGLNAMFFETTLGTRVVLRGPNEDTPVSFKIVGAVSLFSWFAVLFFGRMLPYIGTGN
jgi:hypothetical protein